MTNKEKTDLYQGPKWWPHLIFGVLLLVIGTYLLTLPPSSLQEINQMMGYIIIGLGTLDILLFLINREGRDFRLLMGILEVGLGVFALVNPQTSALVVGLIIGIFLFLQSIILFSYSLRRRSRGGVHRLRYLFGGILSLILAIATTIIFFREGNGLLYLGGSLVVVGIFRLLLMRDLFVVRRQVKAENKAAKKAQLEKKAG